MSRYIIKHAKALIEEYNTRNPFELAEAKDIVVIEQPLGEDTDGAILDYEEGRVIILSDKLNEIKRNFVAAHELLHLTIHNDEGAFIRQKNVYEKKKVLESEGNLFAVELIIDEEFFRTNEGRTIKELSELTGMPENMISNKFDEVLSKNKEQYS